MITFEKKHCGMPNGFGSDFRVYVYKHPKSKNNRVQIVMRMSRKVYEKAGWFVGDFVIPSYDEGKWSWSRTTDRQKGFMVTSTEKSNGTNVYIKFTVDGDTAAKTVPGGSVDCRILSADARTIEAEAANG